MVEITYKTYRVIFVMTPDLLTLAMSTVVSKSTFNVGECVLMLDTSLHPRVIECVMQVKD